MTDPPSSKTHDTGQKDAPLPSESTPFTFTCKCLNLKVNGRIAKEDEKRVEKESRDSIKVYLSVGGEVVKLGGYVTYDQDVFREDDNAMEQEGDILGPSWRICWLCDVKCYEAEGKAKGDEAAQEEWVRVDLGSGIFYGDNLDTESNLLSFSKIRLDHPKSSSNFGRPPSNSTPNPYPAPNSTPDPHHLIPPPHDPFFLPPPFIPNNPHLRDLCDNAGDYLKDAHKKLEDEVRRYISSKTQEMRDLEEKVRGEVEMLWEKYKEGPGKGDVLEQSRSASTSRGGDVSRPMSKDRSVPSDDNPLAKVSTSPSVNPPSASLLAQSLSANAFYAPPPSTAPPDLKDEINKTLDQVANTYNKRDDSRAVAMSYVFSSLADHMGGASVGTSQRRRRSSSKSNGEVPADKDSWIDEERATLRASNDGRMSAVEEEEGEGRTPRPAQVRQLRDEKEAKGKGKGKVTFEEPEGKSEVGSAEVEDTVFDMEMDDHHPPRPQSSSFPPEKLAKLPISRTRNIVEANLSRTFAADAPSHRAAWRRIEENGSMYATLRRGSSSSEDDEGVEDESGISKLAMSMPMAIHLPKSRTRHESVTELERKTSLSDKHGMLVPPLLKAMRQRGIEQNSLGLSSPRGRTQGNRKSSRSASVSREREQMQSYKNDPGALYESLGDECDDEEGENGGDEGTLRDKGFVPPHVLARKNEKDKEREELPDVGWRSLVSS
ncbi:hypothetical protein I302_107740 [Kwoniella bestiolae CBS 10118]|uniref:Uncharacterized protein n=1 Tax=Kwoniella bestiolae CBS 10118 TaxID=1296100 RepID=A0A1B9FXN3_9TREE|nr:hypothetical protein I302_06521 [Kwoniella bestiolae CBS 10118]OCF23538.1 hypothetical protein I302_06521 [Kwoniella bestiolae CBS 10118]